MRSSLAAAAGRLIPSPVLERIAPLLQVIKPTSPDTDDRSAAGRMALVAFSVRVASAAIAYLSQIFLARWMGSFEYGIFVVVWTWVLILGALVHLGFATSVIRLIPEFLATEKLSQLRGLLVGSRVIAVLFATVVAGLGILGAYLFENVISSHYVLPVYLAAVCLPLFTLSEVQDGICRAFNWTDLALAPTYLWRPVLILSLMFVAGLMGADLDATTACVAAIGATWFTAVAQLLMLRGRTREQIDPGPREYHAMEWIRISVPILFVEGFFILLTSTDVVILGQLVSPDQVAVYFAAAKTLALVHFVHYSVRVATAHRFSKLYHSGDTAGLARMVRDSVSWTFWPSLALAAMLMVAGKPLLSLFGAGFTDGYMLLFVLVIGILARASLGPVESLLTMAHLQNYAASVYGGTFLLNATLCFILIPIFGLMGAAVATAFSMVFEATALYWVTRRYLGLRVFIFSRQPADQPAE